VTRSHTITGWNPEDRAAWKAGGKAVARRNLVWSVAAEHVGFSVWSPWSVIVLFMPQSVYGLSAGDKFLIAATAMLVGSALRLPYTMATARLGGRNWTVFSACVLIVPVLRRFWCSPSPAAAVVLPGLHRPPRPRRWKLRIVDDQHQRVLPLAPGAIRNGGLPESES
jgi:MFS transporter, NNP family, nitrate/nitrite transporter